MSIMLSKTYHAFRRPGVSDEQVQEAAEELAGYEKRLIRLEVMTALTLAGVTGLVLGVASLVIKAFL